MRRSLLSVRYDIAVIGSGFAGSIMAMVARKLGFTVLLLERGHHPRVVIGESSTPLSNLLLEELTDRYDLPQLKPLTKWGSWQKTYPHLGSGLKRGFSFFHHLRDQDQARGARPIEERQLLVAGSPNDTVADTHWYRADVDSWLVEQARALGVEYLDEVRLTTPLRESMGWTLTGGRRAETFTLHARLLLDATGPRGFLHNAFALGELGLPGYPATSALYSHFSGVAEFAKVEDSRFAAAPYPVDAAALHHVFAGGWMWVLRFNNGLTSAGAAVTSEVANQLELGTGEPGWRRLLASLPEVEEQFAKATAVRPFTYHPAIAFRSERIAGRGWALLPGAAGFVDPLLSTGFALNLLGVSRLANALADTWGTPNLPEALELYARHTDQELLATAHLIAALYRCMGDFSTFRAVSLLYFAAASYSETARRLGKQGLADGFLLHEHPVYGPRSRRLLTRINNSRSAAERVGVSEEIYNLVALFDVAGLTHRPKDHCYPVRAEDLFSSAHKLGVGKQEIEHLLERTGFYRDTLPYE